MKKTLTLFKSLFKGRLARLDYFTSQFAFALMMLALVAPFAIISSVLSFLVATGVNLNSIEAITSMVLSFVTTLAFIFYYILIVSSIIRRGHDIGWSGLFSILMSILGILIIIPYLFLLFKKSEEGENKYGVLNSGSYWSRLLNI